MTKGESDQLDCAVLIFLGVLFIIAIVLLIIYPALIPWIGGLILTVVLFFPVPLVKGIWNNDRNFIRLMVAYLTVGILLGVALPLYLGLDTIPDHWEVAMLFNGSLIGLSAIGLTIYKFGNRLAPGLSHLGLALWGSGMGVTTIFILDRYYTAPQGLVLRIFVPIFFAISILYFGYAIIAFVRGRRKTAQ